MVELAQLFTDLDQIVMQQEPLVANIEQKGEEVHDNVVKANEEIGGAIEKARSRNRKKWWCLLIVSKYSPTPRAAMAAKATNNPLTNSPVIIIIIIAVVVGVVVAINKK
jgi:syntaxin 1B/2/3